MNRNAPITRDRRDIHVRHILSVNCGSSSVKLALFAMAEQSEDLIATGEVSEIGSSLSNLRVVAHHGDEGEEIRNEKFSDHLSALNALLDRFYQMQLPEPEAAGHRVVHGGPLFQCPVPITPAVLDQLETMVDLAPLHLPANLAGVRLLYSRMSDIAQVACFDTTFHLEMPEIAKRLPLPRSLYQQGVRRYGFHGLSCEYVAEELMRRNLVSRSDRLVIAHLGNGASVTALHDGRTVDTTMGLTPTGGVMMGTRSGDLDPGVIVYLMRHHQLDVDAIERLVNEQSGLRGVSGATSSMQQLQRASDLPSQEAVEMFAYQIRKAVGALAAAMKGIDALTFTGGIGQHASKIRAMICDGLEHLGLKLDLERNRRHTICISRKESSGRVLVMPTNEQLMIARQTMRVVNRSV